MDSHDQISHSNDPKHGIFLTSDSLNEFLGSTDTFLFDCDGVLWRSGNIVPGADKAIEKLLSLGKRVFYITNNSTTSRAEYVHKFEKLGIPATKDQILSSSFATALYLDSISFKKKVYVIGEKGIFDELSEFNISAFGLDHNYPFHWTWHDLENLKPDPEVGAVVIGFDRHTNYYKHCYAYLTVKNNPACLFIATNTDATFPSSTHLLPGGGSTVAPVATALGRQPFVLGKPEPFLLELLKNKYNLNPERTVMVGDRLSTDILFGSQGGLKTLLVFTGVTHQEEYFGEKNNIFATYYASSIDVINQL